MEISWCGERDSPSNLSLRKWVEACLWVGRDTVLKGLHVFAVAWRNAELSLLGGWSGRDCDAEERSDEGEGLEEHF